MSATGTNETPAVVSETNDMQERFEKKGKVVALAHDNQEAFLDFANLLIDDKGQPSYANWTDKADANTFTGLAMVKPDNSAPRLIAIASLEAALSDPTVRAALYKVYVSRVVGAALEDDANPASFITVAGAFKQKFNTDAYKFLAKPLTKILREQGLSGVTNKSLQLAFASSAFAKTQFPRVQDGDWDKIIALAETMASKAGYDTSIYDHWKATRAVASGDTSTLNLDFAKFDEIEIEGDKEETDKPATAPETAPAATV